MTLTTAERAGMLARVGLFASLDDEQRTAIAERAVDVEFEAGRPMVRQGEIGTGLFLIVSGSARVVHDGRDVATLRQGDFFGELSVLDREPRNASVVAVEPTACLAIASWELDRLLEARPQLAIALIRGMAGRLRAVEAGHHA